MFWYFFFPHLWCFSCGVCAHAERRGPRFTGSPVSYLPSPAKSLQTARSSALLPPCVGEIHTPPHPNTPPPSLPPSIFNTRDTSPLPQHGALMPVILNLIKEKLETGNTRSRERRCNGSPVPGTFSSFSVFFYTSNRAVSYFVFKNWLVLTGSRRPTFLPHSVRLQKWKEQSKQVQSAWGGNMYMLVRRKR